MSHYLVAFDTDRIKEYVFATNVLKEIRGASRILDDLNCQTMPALVEGRCIYAHGGSGLFLVESTEQAEQAIARVQQAYADQTGGAATITGVSLAFSEGQFTGVWQRLSQKLAYAKMTTPPFHTSVTGPLLRFGDTDGTFYATEQVNDNSSENGQFISRVSDAKRARNTDLRATLEIPEDFDEIAEHSSVSNYFALIVADGDDMGKVLENCTSLDEIEHTAKGIDQALEAAIDEAIIRFDLPRRSYDTLLLGGDDLILAVPTQVALPMATLIAEEFSRHCAQTLNLPDVTLSAAVVWAHTSFPFGTWQEIASSALTFAKKQRALVNLRRAERGLDLVPNESYINFLVISSANHLDFEAWYNTDLITDEPDHDYRIVRTLRPYTIYQLDRLLSYRRQLARLPRSKLEALRQAVFRPGPRQAMIEALRVLVHWRDETTREIIWELVKQVTLPPGIDQSAKAMFPFLLTEEADDFHTSKKVQVYRSLLADLAEIWDFTEGGKNEEGEVNAHQ